MDVLEKILEEIKDLKKKQNSRNQDYEIGYISALSTVEGIIVGMNNDWIPVTERLPEYGADVLCTEKYTQKIYIGWCDNIRRVGVRWFDSEDFSMEVVAWMPLPEPYKAE